MCNELSHLVISSSKQVQLTSHNSQLTFDSRKPIHSHLLMTARISSIPENRAVIDRAYRYCAKPRPYGVWQQVCRKRTQNSVTRFRVQGASGMQAIKVLRKDHSTVRSLFDKLERTARSAHEKKNDLFEQIRRELQLHMRAEEEIFYPALKAFNEEGWRMVAEALKDHRDIDQLLTQISRLNP